MERKKTKIFLLLHILLLELFSTHQIRAEEITKNKMETNIAEPNEPSNFNDRLSKIESENHEQKLEISLLKTTVIEDKKAIARLTTSLEDQKMVVNQLNGRIVQLESSYANYSTIIEKNAAEIWEKNLSGKDNQKKNGKTELRFTREATAETNSKPINLCSDSSRLCSFFHPDHPDVLKATKSTTNSGSYKKKLWKRFTVHRQVAKN